MTRAAFLDALDQALPGSVVDGVGAALEIRVGGADGSPVEGDFALGFWDSEYGVNDTRGTMAVLLTTAGGETFAALVDLGSTGPLFHSGSVPAGVTATQILADPVLLFTPGSGGRPGEGGAPLPRMNLSHNPSVETSLAGWRQWMGEDADGTGGRVAGDTPFGGHVWRVEWSQSPPAPSGGVNFTSTPVLTPGRMVTVSTYVRPSVDQVFAPALWFYTADCEQVGPPSASTGSVSATAEQWVRVSVTAEVPAGADLLQFRAYASPTEGTVWPVGATMDGDAILIEESTTLGAYFDGDTRDLDGHAGRWVGGPHVSQSELVMTN